MMGSGHRLNCDASRSVERLRAVDKSDVFYESRATATGL
jgi:hypothetical protein